MVLQHRQHNIYFLLLLVGLLLLVQHSPICSSFSPQYYSTTDIILQQRQRRASSTTSNLQQHHHHHHHGRHTRATRRIVSYNRQHPSSLQLWMMESVVATTNPGTMVIDSTTTLVTTSVPILMSASLLPAAASLPTTEMVARGLGYVLGAGSLLLYTPIAIRILRQRSADGLTESTWWLKLASYTCSDIYFITNGYPISTYTETLVITVEAVIILTLVAYYQRRNKNNNDNNIGFDIPLWSGVFGYIALSVWGLLFAPVSVVALGQAGTALLNTGALVPQFVQNAKTQSSGDYSPVTAALAGAGCGIRIFTTIQLAGSDPMLLFTFGLAFLVNSAMLGQILWYGIYVERRDLSDLLLADFVSSDSSNSEKRVVLQKRPKA